MQRQCLIKLLFKFVISMLGWTTACRTRGQSSDEQRRAGRAGREAAGVAVNGIYMRGSQLLQSVRDVVTHNLICVSG